MNKSRTKKVTIPADILAELSALPDHTTVHKIAWTAEMDAVLVQAWATKHRTEAVKLFQKHYGCGCAETLRKRYAEVTA